MKIKLLKKLRKRFNFYHKYTNSGYITYKQWVVLDMKTDKEFPVGAIEVNSRDSKVIAPTEIIQGGIHLATFLSGYQDHHFQSPLWKQNFNNLKKLLHA